MLIERVVPKPPPQITMTFPKDEGWAIVAALKEYALNHPGAVEGDEWGEWARRLERELRR